jgi:hypothetical protein
VARRTCAGTRAELRGAVVADREADAGDVTGLGEEPRSGVAYVDL